MCFKELLAECFRGFGPMILGSADITPDHIKAEIQLFCDGTEGQAASTQLEYFTPAINTFHLHAVFGTLLVLVLALSADCLSHKPSLPDTATGSD
jgi:hypothetical protein